MRINEFLKTELKLSEMHSAPQSAQIQSVSQERADNEKAFQQKQKEAAARAADLEERRKDAPRRAQENKSGVKLD
jgi:hypothetical protein